MCTIFMTAERRSCMRRHERSPSAEAAVPIVRKDDEQAETLIRGRPVTNSWRTVFHRGIVPHLPPAALLDLRDALSIGDPAAMLQGATTSPPPLLPLYNFPVTAANPLVYAVMRAPGLKTVREADEAFTRFCRHVESTLDEAATRIFFDFWHDTPLETAREELLDEVEVALAEHQLQQSA
jgi:hypothetical protein